MLTIKESGRGPKLTIKKSIFICTIFRIESAEEAKNLIEKIKNEFKKASHNAYAYRIGIPINWEESSDDNEVKECAGLPIMNILKKQNLTNILVIVTRFYGGINLGAGRLTRSYSKCAANLINVIGTTEI
ncbi:MAG: YigZ family protein [Candidatus Heimdallarchaeota archaeon]|nr:YigZ family protein [Candidatus Heimdallarchaeota archaeon]